MSAATIDHHRPVLPVLSALVAGAALTLGVLAIATDDVSSVTPQPSPVAVTSTVDEPAVPASTREASGSADVDAGACPFPTRGVVVPC